MGQNPAPPVNIPIPTKIDSFWVLHLPQNGIPLVLTATAIYQLQTKTGAGPVVSGVLAGLERVRLRVPRAACEIAGAGVGRREPRFGHGGRVDSKWLVFLYRDSAKRQLSVWFPEKQEQHQSRGALKIVAQKRTSA